ncbi:MAG: sulfite exporter TauE/SafE family protein [Planctomycetota bacterium]
MPDFVSSTNPYFLLPFGIFIGVFSAFTGLGGGAVIVPVLVLLLGFDQKSAQGTSLGVIASPLQIPAMVKYYGEGTLKIATAAWMLPGVFIGSYFGAWAANALDTGVLKLTFGFILVYVAGYQIFGKAAGVGLGRAVVMSTVLVALAGGLWAVNKWVLPGTTG